MKKTCALALLLVAPLAVPASAQFTDTFDGGFDLTWVTDRFEPYRFQTIADFTGAGKGDILQIGINSDDHQSGFTDYNTIGFYNSQGRKTATPVTGTWSISAELYISPEMIAGTLDWRTDFWARNSPTGDEGDATYWIIGASDVVIGTPENPDRIASFEIWTDTGWLEIGSPVTAAGWYDLGITYDGADAKYYVNNVLTYTASVTDPGALTEVFLQGANLPPPTTPTSDHREYYYWNDVVAVPEPTTYALVMGAVVLVIVGLRRFRNREMLKT